MLRLSTLRVIRTGHWSGLCRSAVLLVSNDRCDVFTIHRGQVIVELQLLDDADGRMNSAVASHTNPVSVISLDLLCATTAGTDALIGTVAQRNIMPEV